MNPFPLPSFEGLEILSLGHSSRSAEDFVALLEDCSVELLVDVRRFPSSKRHPWFRRAPLESTLAQVGIDYRHAEALGGHRDPRPDSPHVALEEPAFRGYADHLATPALRSALAELHREARTRRLALCCAEAGPEHCHRRILCDELVGRGARVLHVLGPDERRVHRLDPRARATAQGLVYDQFLGGQGLLFAPAESPVAGTRPDGLRRDDR